MNQLLNDRLQKKNVLRLSEISVSLFNMSNTVVPMPGIGDEADNGVVVGGFENHLTVLPTKTRPKRIILVIFSVLQYHHLRRNYQPWQYLFCHKNITFHRFNVDIKDK